LVTLELPKCKETGSRKKSQPSQSLGNERFLKVSYNELLKATDGFSRENLIGEGGFSSVYKGNLDYDDGRVVAIKVLHLQNRGAHKSFLAECEAWRNIRHRNLLKIITSCSSVDFQGNDFKALVYEFMPNGSLHDWLHSSENTLKLNLLQITKILMDVATALDYLHNRFQTTIVHARLLGKELNQNSSTGVKGTIGYAPPEYGLESEMTSSRDVYSFGILLLEVVLDIFEQRARCTYEKNANKAIVIKELAIVSSVTDPTLNRSLAGALQTSHLPDPICLYMHDPREPHLNAIKCVLRYLRGTTDLRLQLFRSTTSQLIAYSDADWAGYPAMCRSTFGYCVFLGDNLLTWSSKRQDTLSRSSAEAEYHRVANAVAETSWIRNLLRELNPHFSQRPWSTVIMSVSYTCLKTRCNINAPNI
nr:protein kinase-like domain-containing protein [Tanacetum cinerariifolium]